MILYLSMGCAGISPPESMITASILQTETGLVSLGYFKSCYHVKQVVITEGVHAVVVPEGVRQIKLNRVLFRAIRCTDSNNNKKIKKKILFLFLV